MGERVRVLMAWPENYGFPEVGLALRYRRAVVGAITAIAEDGAVYAEVDADVVAALPQAEAGGVWTVVE